MRAGGAGTGSARFRGFGPRAICRGSDVRNGCSMQPGGRTDRIRFDARCGGRRLSPAAHRHRGCNCRGGHGPDFVLPRGARLPRAASRTATFVSHGTEQDARGRYFYVLALSALGVVYGDIGTSPLYAIRESLGEHYGLAPVPRQRAGRAVADLLVAHHRHLHQVPDVRHAGGQPGRGGDDRADGAGGAARAACGRGAGGGCWCWRGCSARRCCTATA